VSQQINNSQLFIDPSGDAFFAQIATYLSLEDRRWVRSAFEFAKREHGDDRRKSGELFFTHPLTVAFYLSEYYVDAPTLIAALLHDVAEDTRVSVAEIEAEFGREVAKIVDGLTKFDKVAGQAEWGRDLTADEMKNATLHKLFAMMVSDVRVGIVKIFDRLHNMRTLYAVPPHKQVEKSQEVLHIYAPLANRLGMWLVKNELQTWAMKYIDPNQFAALQAYITWREAEQDEEFKAIAEKISHELSQNGIAVADVLAVPITVYELGQYLAQKRITRVGREIEFPTRMAVLVKDVPHCYTALGLIHGLWRPVPGSFDDYIAAPRENLYRSLHTTVMYGGRQMKIRLRTLSMHIESQMGVLSRWSSNFTMPVWSQAVSVRVDEMLAAIGESIEQEGQEIGEGVRTVLEDVFKDQIVVYTPTGEMRELPKGATVLDFAYMIHTELGHGCRGAMVNGRNVPPNYRLQAGESVQVLRRGSQPQRMWLDEYLGYLQTSAGKAAVRRWFRRLRRGEAMAQGEALLQEELVVMGLTAYTAEEVAGLLGIGSVGDLYYALGRADVLPTAVAQTLLTHLWQTKLNPTIIHEDDTSLTPCDDIENTGGRRTRLCGTCQPQRGDRIVGYLRKDGGITVHNPACTLLRHDDMRGSRLLKLRWGQEQKKNSYPVTIRIDVHDRDGLLSEIASLLRDERINITSICSRSKERHGKQQATILLGIAVASVAQLVGILHRIQAMKNVYAVQRLADWPLNGSKLGQAGVCQFMLLEQQGGGGHGRVSLSPPPPTPILPIPK
jgi:GTP diphosphokinase / guanosine-3',5'-bis(diphosphate) 3'-diphosphatase